MCKDNHCSLNCIKNSLDCLEEDDSTCKKCHTSYCLCVCSEEQNCDCEYCKNNYFYDLCLKCNKILKVKKFI